MVRTIVIGDIHGALKALRQLLQILHLHEDDLLIFLGDYVDGWSEAAPLISFLIDLDKKYNCIFIKGNHDTWCQSWLGGEEADPVWLFHGGQSTVESYSKLSRPERKKHLAFFERMKLYHTDEQNRLFIHAGFSSMHGPGLETYPSNFYWDRTLWEMALAIDHRIDRDSKFYPKRLLLFREIYIGHTPTLNYDTELPMQACNVWNMDTGAAFGGKLSAMDIDTKRLWQSDFTLSLYPGERGRIR